RGPKRVDDERNRLDLHDRQASLFRYWHNDLRNRRGVNLTGAECCQARHGAPDWEVSDILVGIEADVANDHARDLPRSPADLRGGNNLSFQLLRAADLFGHGEDVR